MRSAVVALDGAARRLSFFAFASHGNVHDRYFFKQKRDMIAGAVAPPRIDVVNKELIEAHLHSTWLSIVKPSLGTSVRDVLDLDQVGANFPILTDILAQLQPSAGHATKSMMPFARS